MQMCSIDKCRRLTNTRRIHARFRLNEICSACVHKTPDLSFPTQRRNADYVPRMCTLGVPSSRNMRRDSTGEVMRNRYHRVKSFINILIFTTKWTRNAACRIIGESRRVREERCLIKISDMNECALCTYNMYSFSIIVQVYLPLSSMRRLKNIACTCVEEFYIPLLLCFTHRLTIVTVKPREILGLSPHVVVRKITLGSWELISCCKWSRSCTRSMSA